MAVTPQEIAGLVASVTQQSIITIPADALAGEWPPSSRNNSSPVLRSSFSSHDVAFKALEAGQTLSATEIQAVQKCANAARANNTASKLNLGCDAAGNIVFDTYVAFPPSLSSFSSPKVNAVCIGYLVTRYPFMLVRERLVKPAVRL